MGTLKKLTIALTTSVIVVGWFVEPLPHEHVPEREPVQASDYGSRPIAALNTTNPLLGGFTLAPPPSPAPSW
jgi:hypothetical protein